jgi:hypothetical protein
LPYSNGWALLVCGVGVFVGADPLALFVEEVLFDEPTYPINIVELPSAVFRKEESAPCFRQVIEVRGAQVA